MESNPALAGQLSLAAYKLAATPEGYGSILNESSQRRPLPAQAGQHAVGTGTSPMPAPDQRRAVSR
jgi:hypothetical protein